MHTPNHLSQNALRYIKNQIEHTNHQQIKEIAGSFIKDCDNWETHLIYDLSRQQEETTDEAGNVVLVTIFEDEAWQAKETKIWVETELKHRSKVSKIDPGKYKPEPWNLVKHTTDIPADEDPTREELIDDRFDHLDPLLDEVTIDFSDTINITTPIGVIHLPSDTPWEDVLDLRELLEDMNNEQRNIEMEAYVVTWTFDENEPLWSKLHVIEAQYNKATRWQNKL